MEEFLKIITVLGALFAAYKIIVDVIIARSTKHREDYQFTKDYISDLYNPEVHRFVLEKGFRALTGSFYSVEEIKYLLSFSEPTQAIFLRTSTKNMIEFNIAEGRYNWLGIYDKSGFKVVGAYVFLALYSITAFIAITPFLFKAEQNFVTTVSMSILAIFFVIRHIDYADTIKFMELEKNNIQIIDNDNKS